VCFTIGDRVLGVARLRVGEKYDNELTTSTPVSFRNKLTPDLSMFQGYTYRTAAVLDKK
jgi:hypothetical protein